MRRMKRQLGILGTISAFAYRHRENKKNLCQGGWSQDLPSTDFQSACLLLYSALGCLISEVSRSCSFGHTTHGRTCLDKALACCRYLYLTTHNIHNRQTTKCSVGFKPTIPSSKQPQTHALDCVATGISCKLYSPYKTKMKPYIRLPTAVRMSEL